MSKAMYSVLFTHVREHVLLIDPTYAFLKSAEPNMSGKEVEKREKYQDVRALSVASGIRGQVNYSDCRSPRWYDAIFRK
jgi:hypothetical protein